MKIKLKSFEWTELKEKKIETKLENLSVNDFNLLISDNAQGKTRLFRTLNFLSNLFKDKPPIIRTDFSAAFNFEIMNSTGIEKVVYELNIQPVNGENNFNERVMRNNRILYSSKEKILVNESTDSEVKNYFIPKNLPALSSINEPDFITINLLRGFFQRIVWISANKSREINVVPAATIPDASGSNISSVLNNWKKSYPEIFNEVMNEFKDCFPFIKEVFFTQQDIQGVMKADVLTFNEEDIDSPILQTQWSDGLYRILFLLMATKIPFVSGEETMPPSLILVDEIENGLDFNRLKYIINYFKDYADDSQIIISSHSPLVCDFVHPRNWKVVKRKGAELHFISPHLQEEDLDSQLDLFKHKHWEFYTKHISNSEKYTI
jgi:energy-coupling factor transporter ATP-binding protein EcfA2